MLREDEVRNRTTHAAEEIEPDERASSPLVFQPRAEHPEREHVEREVRKPRVSEHVCDYRPPVGREAGRIESERRVHRLWSKQRQLQEIHADVQRQQPLNSARHAWRFRYIVQLAHADLRLRDHYPKTQWVAKGSSAESIRERALRSAHTAPGS